MSTAKETREHYYFGQSERHHYHVLCNLVAIWRRLWRDLVRASDTRQFIVMSITKQMLSDAPIELQARPRGAVSKSRLRSGQVTLSASSDVAQKHLGPLMM